jgi:hypothetical protein
MTARFLYGAIAGVLFAVLCMWAAVKDLTARAFSRKQSLQEGQDR